MNEQKNSPCSEKIRRVLFYVLIAISVVSFLTYAVLRIADTRGKRTCDELESVFYSHGFNGDILESMMEEKSNIMFSETETKAHPETDILENVTEIDYLTETDADTEVFETQDPEYEAMIEVCRNELSKMREGLLELSLINSDICGWIRIGGTVIDYPVVQGKDNEYYLNFSYTKEYLPAGSIFVDYRCEKQVDENYNTVLFGHNAELSGTMFHDLEKFLDAEFFSETYIYIYSADGVYVYEPFSIYVTRSDYNYFRTSFENDSDFEEFVREVGRNTSVGYDGDLSDVKNIITLSTCTNGASNIRYALHAKLIEQITVTEQ